MRRTFDYQGAECRREFKYPWYGLIISAEVAGQREEIEVIEESLTGHGFSAKTDGFRPLPYTLVTTNWTLNGRPRQYVSLPSNPLARLRFRYLFDTEEDPMQVIAAKI
ncbi:unnamed protein product [marine sediment metagenome]|uniref:Uncharacterized protein n=1 Tax=marine sediment metagenome TaxID=412755 RepID=X1JKT4_9ZZZZ